MILARFFVAGTPATQGSKRIVQPKGHRRPLLLEMSKKLPAWRTAVAAEAFVQRVQLGATLDEPLTVSLSFYFLRPKKPTRPFPRPDLDKLVRAVGDSLVQGQLLADDCLIVSCTAQKRWTDDPTRVGCAITVYGIAVIQPSDARDTVDPPFVLSVADLPPPRAAVPSASLAGRAGIGRSSGTPR
jgi:Holliday junction resolvase RusA-like endonuclease